MTAAGAAAPALVFGATGYAGRAVVHELRRRGVPTVAHVRPDSPSLPRWREEFGRAGATVDTTPWEEAAIAATVAGLRPAHLFLLLGTTRARAADPARRSAVADDYEAVDFGLTAMAIRAAAPLQPPPHLTYLSAMGAGGSGGNAYLAVRNRVERILREGPNPWLVARPGFVTGPDRDERRPLERGAAIVADGVLAVVGRLGGRAFADRWRSIDAGELARGLVSLALAHPRERIVADPARLRRG